MSERKYIAISIKHSEYERTKRPVLWGDKGKSKDDEKRCFAGYTCNIDKAELYSLNDFQSTHGNGCIKCDEPVKVRRGYLKRYKNFDTVLVDENELRTFLKFI